MVADTGVTMSATISEVVDTAFAGFERWYLAHGGGVLVWLSCGNP